MNTPMNLEDASRRIVYVKPIAVADLPQEVQDAAGGLETLQEPGERAGDSGRAEDTGRQLLYSV